MRILCLTTFLDGVDRFEQGDSRTVDDARGARFVAAGWASDTSAATSAPVAGADAGAVNLDIQNALLGAGDSNG